MSTRSLIGIEEGGGKVRYVYCHSDGYLEGVGETLQDNYNDAASAKAIVDMGGVSSLDGTLEDTIFYARDRKEEIDISTVDTAAAFWEEDHGTEYWYLFSNGGWLVKTDSYGPISIKDAIAKEAEADEDEE